MKRRYYFELTIETDGGDEEDARDRAFELTKPDYPIREGEDRHLELVWVDTDANPEGFNP